MNLRVWALLLGVALTPWTLAQNASTGDAPKPVAPGARPSGPPAPGEESDDFPEEDIKIPPQYEDVGPLPHVDATSAGPAGAPLAFSGLTSDGKTIVVPHDYKGKFVFIHVWSTQTPHCQREVRFWKRMYDRLHRGPFEMIGVITDANRDVPVSQSKAYVAGKKITWTQLYEDGPRIAAELGVTRIPAVFLVDADTGTILFRDDAIRGAPSIPLVRAVLAAKRAPTSQPAADERASTPGAPTGDKKP